MPEIEINDLASIGLIRDTPSYMLPPEAWSLAENVRFRNEGVECMPGWAQIFGSPLYPPHFAIPYSSPAQTYWLYVSLNNAAVYDGASHTDITRATGVYNAGETRNWNGTVLGGIPIFNNGVDVPQYWAAASVGTKLANLPNWPSTARAKVLRSFGPYLVAVNVTVSGSSFPHMVRWSHPADPGSVPSSWDVTDPATDAGQNDLSDVNSGVLLDALQLRSGLFLYKQNAIWIMTYRGGQFIFDFQTFRDSVGLLAPRCVCVTGDGERHVLVTQDDMIWHNGNQSESILNKRQRKKLFDEMDSINFINSFIFCNRLFNEIWFCYPTAGQEYPNKALVWNYESGGRGTITEVTGITFRGADNGVVETSTDEAWGDTEELWDDDTGPWSELSRRRTIVFSPVASKFLRLDDGYLRDGVAYSATLAREGLSLLGKKRSGEWIVDHEQIKMANAIWPKVVGGPIRIRFGSQMVVGGPTTWGAYMSFDPGTDVVKYQTATGRALGVEFSTVQGVAWRIDGYKYDVKTLGRF